MMSRDYLFRNKFQPPKKFGVKMGVKKSLEFFFWQGGRNRLEATPFFFCFRPIFCVFSRFITTREGSRVGVARANTQAKRRSRKRDRQKERKKEEESIHSSVLRGRSPRSPPTIAVKKNMMGKRETLF